MNLEKHIDIVIYYDILHCKGIGRIKIIDDRHCCKSFIRHDNTILLGRAFDDFSL